MAAFRPVAGILDGVELPPRNCIAAAEEAYRMACFKEDWVPDPFLGLDPFLDADFESGRLGELPFVCFNGCAAAVRPWPWGRTQAIRQRTATFSKEATLVAARQSCPSCWYPRPQTRLP